MAPPKRPWFRFYTEALTDPKLRRLTAVQRWAWVSVLGAARQSPISGFLLLTEREPLTNADLADLAGVSIKEMATALSRMSDLGLIENDANIGAWYVTKWNDRQYESDDTTKRTAKHRSKAVDEPLMERSNNVDGTHQSTEADSETEAEGGRGRNRLRPDTRKAVLAAAATLLAERRPGARDRGDRYFGGTVRGIADDYADKANGLLTANSQLTAEELADALEPPPKPASSEKLIDGVLHRFVQSTGWVPLEQPASAEADMTGNVGALRAIKLGRKSA